MGFSQPGEKICFYDKEPFGRDKLKREYVANDSINNQFFTAYTQKGLASANTSTRKKRAQPKRNIKIQDDFTITGGTIPLFILDGASIPVWIMPKFSHPLANSNLYIGAGGLAGTVIGKSHTFFGILYGNITVGSSDKNFSVGAGYLTYGYTGQEMERSPVFTISGKVRTSGQWFFLSDNYFFNTKDGLTGIISLSGRRMTKKAGFDFGAFIPIGGGTDTFIAIPWLGVTFPFGNANKRL